MSIIVRSSVLGPLLSCSLALLGACGTAPEEESVSDDRGDDAASIDEALVAGKKPAIVQRFEDATAGLLMMSESDYPFQVLFWRRPGGLPDAVRLAQLTGENSTGPVEERTLDAFFAGATATQPEYGPEELATVERYRALVKLIRRDLRHVRVFRYGTIQIHAYVVGVTKSGDWLALATTQIET
jgi:hypothetical protein